MLLILQSHHGSVSEQKVMQVWEQWCIYIDGVSASDAALLAP